MGGGVTIFLILSGYGVSRSFSAKGLGYYWIKKIVRICIPWLLVWTISLFVNFCFNKQNIVEELKLLLLISSGNWFLQFLFLWYIIFYITHKWLYKNRWIIISFSSMVIFASLGNTQAEQALSFPFGVLIAENSKGFVFLKTRSKEIGSLVLFAFATFLFLKNTITIREQMNELPIIEHAVNLLIKLPLGMFVIVALKDSCTLTNNFLKFTGIISYELFLVHLFVVFKVVSPMNNFILQFLSLLVLSYLGAIMLHKINGKISKKLFSLIRH